MASRLTPPPIWARFILSGFLALLVFSATTASPDRVPAGTAAPPGADDAALFSAVVGRVAEGGSYYQAMAWELHQRKYPSSSVFNWRTPVLFEVLAVTGLRRGWWLLAALSALAMVLAVKLFEHNLGALELLLGVIALIGAFLVALAPELILYTEVWCGLLIALSVLVFSRSQWTLGAALGIGALFIRELAAPYCIACVIIALRAKRWRELAFWGVGAAAYLVFFGYHVQQVWAYQSHTDFAHRYSWLRWLGIPFVIETMTRSNSVLLFRPRILTACSLVLALSSVFAANTPAHLKAVVLGYTLFFCVVGQQFNAYWGLTPALVVAMAIAFGPKGIWSLIKRARADLT